ncbi:TetR/AcrR family transcriptional regulator [Brevibacterium sp. S111]|nr:TetR/AcrR family transcriptional regulator [Brevibacterium sp. S111]
MASVVNKRRGRPRGVSDTSDRLIDAGRRQFLAHGYRAVSARSIAAEAGVDHAMVNYHFGGKEGLFNAVLDLVISPGAVFDSVVDSGPGSGASTRTDDDFARRLLNAAIVYWDAPTTQTRLRRLLSDADENSASAGTTASRSYIETQLFERLVALIGGENARGWASGAAATIAGVFVTRYVYRIEPIVSMSRQEIVYFVAPALHASLTKRRLVD